MMNLRRIIVFWLTSMIISGCAASPRKTGIRVVKVLPLNEATWIIASNIASNLPTGNQSVAVIPPRNTEGKENKSFEIRITEAINNHIEPLLPKGYRLADRFTLIRIFKDSTAYGEENKLDNFLENAGVDINITGSYSILEKEERVEIRYRAIQIKDSKILTTAKTLYIPLSELSKKKGGVLVLVKSDSIMSAKGGQDIIRRTTVLTNNLLSKNKLSVIETQWNPKKDDFMTVARRNNANFLIILEVEGKKQYTDFGNNKGDVSIVAKVFKIPEGDIIYTVKKKKEALTVSGEENPLLKAIDWIINKIGADLVESLVQKSELKKM